MRAGKVRCIAVASLALATTAYAQDTPKIEPGLWEVAFTLKSDNGQVEAAVQQARRQLAALPPAQRQAAEQMMRARGIKLGDDVNTARTCITPEDAARGEIPQQPGARCTQQIIDRSSSTLRVKFSCESSPPASGEGTITFQNPTTYTSQALVDTVVAGTPQRIRVDQTGRWLAADCGEIRPLGR
jgi:hypothetical protein